MLNILQKEIEYWRNVSSFYKEDSLSYRIARNNIKNCYRLSKKFKSLTKS